MRRLLVAGLVCSWTAWAAAQEVALEYRVKAAYLLNFTRFVEWPGAALSRTDAFTICAAGRNPFGPALASTVAGERAGGLPLAARVVTPAEAASCQVLFVPGTIGAAPYLRAVNSAPVLTVGEHPDFLAQGGAINFVLERGRVRFEISQAAAQRAQLRISSRLLQLGRGSGAPGDD